MLKCVLLFKIASELHLTWLNSQFSWSICLNYNCKKAFCPFGSCFKFTKISIYSWYLLKYISTEKVQFWKFWFFAHLWTVHLKIPQTIFLKKLLCTSSTMHFCTESKIIKHQIWGCLLYSPLHKYKSLYLSIDVLLEISRYH